MTLSIIPAFSFGRGSATMAAMKADEIAAQVKAAMGEQLISIIYRDRIRPMRTRSYQLQVAGANGTKRPMVEILHTLLGVELKIGKRRLLCPDLATARYLSVFARMGAPEVAVPYDITQISRLADELESSWFRMLTLIEHLTIERSARLHSRAQAKLITDLRNDLIELGAGPAVPQFNQNTKQRKPKLR